MWVMCSEMLSRGCCTQCQHGPSVPLNDNCSGPWEGDSRPSEGAVHANHPVWAAVGVVLAPGMIPAPSGVEVPGAAMRALLVMSNHRQQECPWAGGRAVTVGTVEVTRGNKDSGTAVRFRSHLQLGRGLRNGTRRPGSDPGQGEERGGFANGKFPSREHGER